MAERRPRWEKNSLGKNPPPVKPATFAETSAGSANSIMKSVGITIETPAASMNLSAEEAETRLTTCTERTTMEMKSAIENAASVDAGEKTNAAARSPHMASVTRRAAFLQSNSKAQAIAKADAM